MLAPIAPLRATLVAAVLVFGAISLILWVGGHDVPTLSVRFLNGLLPLWVVPAKA